MRRTDRSWNSFKPAPMPWENATCDLMDTAIFGRWRQQFGSLSALRMWGLVGEMAAVVTSLDDAEGRIADEAALRARMAAWGEQRFAADRDLGAEWARFWDYARRVGGGMERRRIAREGR